MVKKTKMSSTELGGLWLTYHKKTMILRMLEYFIESTEDQQGKNLMSGLWKKLHPKILELNTMLDNEGAITPVGFTNDDVNLAAPKLFENGFDVMFSRILKEISMGMYVLHTTIAYREDIIKYYRELTEITQTYYDKFTQYLLENNLIPRPNYTSMPKSNDFITDPTYMKGTNIAGHKRMINTVEYGILYHGVATNVVGMQLMKAFEQCAIDKDAKKYFKKGLELSKEILHKYEKILLENDIQSPTTSGGTITDSKEAPFSDKMMMFCTYLLGGFSVGGQGFSATFMMRNDIKLKSSVFAKDVYGYTMEGVKLMMEKGWMEEPPKMEL